MGNAGSNQPVSHHHGSSVNREHRHTKEHPPPSPGKEGQAFVFDKKPSQKLVFQSSEEEPYYSKVYSIRYYIESLEKCLYMFRNTKPLLLIGQRSARRR